MITVSHPLLAENIQVKKLDDLFLVPEVVYAFANEVTLWREAGMKLGHSMRGHIWREVESEPWGVYFNAAELPTESPATSYEYCIVDFAFRCRQKIIESTPGSVPAQPKEK